MAQLAQRHRWFCGLLLALSFALASPAQAATPCDDLLHLFDKLARGAEESPEPFFGMNHFSYKRLDQAISPACAAALASGEPLTVAALRAPQDFQVADSMVTVLLCHTHPAWTTARDLERGLCQDYNWSFGEHLCGDCLVTLATIADPAGLPLAQKTMQRLPNGPGEATLWSIFRTAPDVVRQRLRSLLATAKPGDDDRLIGLLCAAAPPIDAEMANACAPLLPGLQARQRAAKQLAAAEDQRSRAQAKVEHAAEAERKRASAWRITWPTLAVAAGLVGWSYGVRNYGEAGNVPPDLAAGLGGAALGSLALAGLCGDHRCQVEGGGLVLILPLLTGIGAAWLTDRQVQPGASRVTVTGIGAATAAAVISGFVWNWAWE